MTPAENHTDDRDSEQPRVEELISLREAAERSGLSASHLRLLVRRGDIWGMKLGRNWVTTAQAVEQYVARDNHLQRKQENSHDPPST